jgi:hypothetical protein
VNGCRSTKTSASAGGGDRREARWFKRRVAPQPVRTKATHLL